MAGAWDELVDDSVVLQWLRRNRFDEIAAGSTIAQSIPGDWRETGRATVRGARAYDLVVAGKDRLLDEWHRSGLRDRLTTSKDTLVDATRASGTAYLVAEWRTVLEHAFLYRWLTAEPEPEVIVIDLRDTWTVGPQIAALDRMLGSLIPYSRYSAVSEVGHDAHDIARAVPVKVAGIFLFFLGFLAFVFTAGQPTSSGPALVASIALMILGVAATRIDWSWSELVESRLGQLLAEAFAPPEPIEPHEESREPEHREE